MLLMDTTPTGSRRRECWVWFAEEPFRPAGYEIVRFKEARLEVPSDLFSPEPFDTLFSDLRLSEEELWKKLHNTRRKHVRRARKQNWSIVSGNDDVAVRRFHTKFSEFAVAKKLAPPLSLAVLLRNSHCCMETFAYDKDGKVVCWFNYVLDKPIARQWYGGSDLAYDRKDRGYAAALLHWEMMLHFKREGYEIYDWGGVVLDPADPRYSVTQFKAQFGGEPERRFNYWCRFPPSPGRRVWRRLLRGLRTAGLRTV